METPTRVRAVLLKKLRRILYIAYPRKQSDIYFCGLLLGKRSNF
jgi:hypothetical protein